jgi:hypothetical protein
MRDLTDADPEAIAAQRSRVAAEGWGVAFQNLTIGFRVTKSAFTLNDLQCMLWRFRNSYRNRARDIAARRMTFK